MLGRWTREEGGERSGEIVRDERSVRQERPEEMVNWKDSAAEHLVALTR